MPRREAIRIPACLQPLLQQPPDWPTADAFRVAAAACRASGVVAWAARLQSPTGQQTWLEGRSQSRPGIVQSECVDALIAALQATPPGAAVEIIAPTSLRYLVEGAGFPSDSPEHQLYRLATERRIWARYALGELEAPVSACLRHAYTSLAPLRWPGEAALEQSYALYTDGGCSPHVCASAWVLRGQGETIAECAWCLPGPVAPDAVRLAEFLAAADGLNAVPPGASVALVTDHADVSDFGVRGVPAFRPSSAVAAVLGQLRERASQRDVRWYWAAHDETDGQRRCQQLIDRQLQAATAWPRFAATCRAAGLDRIWVPDFNVWLAPREPLLGQPDERRVLGQPHERWAATFEPRDRFLAADRSSPRIYIREMRLDRPAGLELAETFERSRARGWCTAIRRVPSLGGAAWTYLAELRSGFDLVVLLFEPDTALLLQTRPGATLDDLLAATAHVRQVELVPADRCTTPRPLAASE